MDWTLQTYSYSSVYVGYLESCVFGGQGEVWQKENKL